jgi:hypothetical protein
LTEYAHDVLIMRIFMRDDPCQAHITNNDAKRYGKFC